MAIVVTLDGNWANLSKWLACLRQYTKEENLGNVTRMWYLDAESNGPMSIMVCMLVLAYLCGVPGLSQQTEYQGKHDQ